MDKKLNTDILASTLEAAGLTQKALAEQIGVTKQAVSKWLSGKDFPRPDKLLKLAVTLGIKFDELVIKQPQESDPIVAFRKMRGRKTTEEHISRAKDMGRLLSKLVPYLPYDELKQPATLKQPVNEYSYIQKVVKTVRHDISLQDTDEIDFGHLIKKFKELQAVIIPVLWGQKNRHENALHIYLPDSMTTWIYLNLDVEVHDFKFWMAHELGHVHSPQLRGEEAEDFADSFAGALLFPEPLAKTAYEGIAELSKSRQVNTIKSLAKNYVISPFSVYIEINRYAKEHGHPEIQLDNIGAVATKFNQQYINLSKALFDEAEPTPKEELPDY